MKTIKFLITAYKDNDEVLLSDAGTLMDKIVEVVRANGFHARIDARPGEEFNQKDER